MGKELDRKSKRQRFRIFILSGKTRPIDRHIASMYATACSIAVNEAVPVLTHYKLYKERNDIYRAYSGHVSVRFVSLSSSY